jgi:hypothetical protein
MEDQIRNLVSREKGKEIKQVSWWNSPSVVQPLSRALLAKHTIAMLEGKDFSIKYTDDGKAWVKSKEGFAPCAWITIDEYAKSYEQSTG